MVKTDLQKFIPQDDLNRKYPVEGITAEIDRIRTDISSNGNKYTAVILEDNTWLFTWWDGNQEDGFEPGHWAEHLETYQDFYKGRVCEISVTNSNYYDENGKRSEKQPFYNIAAISPKNPEDAEKLLTLIRKHSHE